MKFLNSKPRRTIIVLLVTVSACMLAAPIAAAKKVAAVNGIYITDADVAFVMRQFKQRMAQQKQVIPENRLEAMRNRILENIINRELLYQASQKKGLKIDDKQLENSISSLKAKFPNTEAFEKTMLKMGTTEKDLRTQLSKGYAIDRLIKQEVVEGIEVSEKECRAYFDNHPELFTDPERVKASHILIKSDANDDGQQKEKAKKKILDIQLALKAGENFEELAKKYSEGPNSAKGGDLGYFQRRKMVKPFENAAFQLNPGEISDIVETRSGFHLIKVFDKTPAKPQVFAEKKEQIAKTLKRNKIQNALKVYIEKLRKAAKIEKF